MADMQNAMESGATQGGKCMRAANRVIRARHPCPAQGEVDKAEDP